MLKPQHIAIIAFLLTPALLKAQGASDNLSERGILLRYERTGGAHIHTNGFGINFKQGKHITTYLRGTIEAELTTMKHPKEYKIINPYYSEARSFIYGKMNTLTILRLGIGIQKILNDKSRAINNAVELRSHWNFGLSSGFIKPVYLNILHKNSNGDISYEPEKYNPTKHNRLDSIYGRAFFLKGINSLKYYPGLYFKYGISADYAPGDDLVRSLEIGVIADLYLKEIPIMAFIKNKNLFISLYISFNIGKRYNS